MSPLPALLMLLTVLVIQNNMRISRMRHRQRMDHLRRMRNGQFSRQTR